MFHWFQNAIFKAYFFFKLFTIHFTLISKVWEAYLLIMCSSVAPIQLARPLASLRCLKIAFGLEVSNYISFHSGLNLKHLNYRIVRQVDDVN